MDSDPSMGRLYLKYNSIHYVWPKAKERTMAVWALVVNYIATLLSPGNGTRFVGERWDLGFQI